MLLPSEVQGGVHVPTCGPATQPVDVAFSEAIRCEKARSWLVGWVLERVSAPGEGGGEDGH